MVTYRITGLCYFCFVMVWSTVAAQTLEFGTAEKLPASVNSHAEESMPLLSPDGTTLYFSRSLFTGNRGGQFAGPDVWLSVKNGRLWQEARNALTINNRKNNVVVGIGKDGRTLYVVNSSGWEKAYGVQAYNQHSGRFTRSRMIPIPEIENLGFLGFYVSPDADVIFLSMKADDSRGSEDIYFSVKGRDGLWSKPRNVGSTINTPGFEISPFLSADKKRLYFASNGHGGFGDADIYYSERLYDSWETWSAPVNLGDGVNSKKFDAYFSLFGDTVAFLASNRDSRYADIYRVPVREVKTILSADEHYFTDAEWSAEVGQNVARKIAFERNSTELTAAQKELLFYIVNKVMLKRDIRFHLVIREEDDPGLTEKRLQAVYDNLRQSGIDPLRINQEQLNASKKSDKGVIEILLLQ